MKSALINQYEISILVDNKPITEYQHEGSVFVEGRSGSEYTIRARNNSSDRACFILSVDGLSILNGKECANDSPGYILSPWQTLDIACYKVDDETGAKFVFGAKEKSYSAEIGKGTVNVGVIAAMVFREQPRLVHRHTGCFGGHPVWPDNGSVLRKMASSTKSSRGWGPSDGIRSMGTNTAMGMGSIATNSAGPTFSANASLSMDSFSMPTAEPQAEEQSLGTVFGGSMGWKTQTVEFKREANPAVSLIMYYDSRKNLERRGIKFEQKTPPLPNPFPGNEGCATPPNWRK